MTMNDDHLVSLVEDMNSKMDGVVEAVGQIQDQIKVLPVMRDDIEQLKNDVQVIKQVVTEQEQRLSHLETT
jgi:predicted transcriptional regulator